MIFVENLNIQTRCISLCLANFLHEHSNYTVLKQIENDKKKSFYNNQFPNPGSGKVHFMSTTHMSWFSKKV